MKSVPSMAIARTMLFLALFTTSLWAEDWTTSDGKVYPNVTVVKAEPDAVTILYRDGGALVPLGCLPADLQKRFHYDPARAEAAEDQRARDELESEMALQAEIKKLKDLKKEIRSAQKAAAEAERLKDLQAKLAAYSFEPAVLEPQNHNGIMGPPTDSNHYRISDALPGPSADPNHHPLSDIQGNLVPSALPSDAGPASPSQTNINVIQTTAEPAQNAAAPQELTRQLTASRIRLIGKVRACVSGGYILESLSAQDGYTIRLDPSRPDYQLVNERAPGGAVFLYAPSQTHFENEILDLDVYPVGAYTTLSGETMPSLTTSALLARAYLELKENR